MALPLFKLATLALRTISKPIASRLKNEAGKHPRFRELIISLAQSNHRLTTNIQRRLYGHATDAEIRPLNEEKAVQNAADLLGEVFVFGVAGVLVIFEVQRSSRSEARKESQRKEELEAIKQSQDDLKKELEFLKQKLDEIDQLARGKGLAGFFRMGHQSSPTESPNPVQSV